MDKEWVEETIRGAIRESGAEDVYVGWLKGATGAIVQAHEAEMADAVKQAWESAGKHYASSVDADNALYEHFRDMDPNGDYSPAELVEVIDKDRKRLYGVLDEEIDLRFRAQDKVALLRALVAEMREVLRDLSDNWFHKHYPADVFVGGAESDDGVNEVVRLREMIDRTLASVPEVLYHGQAQVSGIGGICTPDIHEDNTGLPMVAYMPEGTNTFVGAPVDVFVLARPQGRESEQENSND